MPKLSAMNTPQTDPIALLPENPASYPRRVLLAVSGLSPQIVTETIYALAVREGGKCVPTEVHIITTEKGAQEAELSLLSESMGWFHKLCADYQLPPIAFSRDHIHVMTDANGKGMNDIRSIEDNSAAADFITAQVSRFSSDPQCALHVSIAGGRKTMGFYLGYALSLYGRAQDRLSHVLVSEPFEGSYEFYYPTPYSRVLGTRDRGLADTATAIVTLAEIPFVSLRNDLPKRLLEGRASFSETVDAARIALAPHELLIDLRGKRIRASGKVVEIAPMELALLAVFARRAQGGLPALPAPVKSIASPATQRKTRENSDFWAASYMEEYKRIVGTQEANERDLDGALGKMNGENFSSRKSKLRDVLAQALGPAVKPYLIDDGGTKPGKYQLTLPPQSIHFVTREVFDEAITESQNSQK